MIDFLVGLIEDAVGGVLDFLGISSPSRLMHQISGYTAQGFAKGIADATPLAARAADQFAGTAAFTPAPADSASPRQAEHRVITRSRHDNSTLAVKQHRTRFLRGHT